MKDLYQRYVEEKRGVWSDSSYRSESKRLNKLLHLLDGDAAKLFEAMADYHPNARATYWVRVTNFWDWCIKKGHKTGENPYKVFRTENPRPFRGVYERQPCMVPFKTLEQRIAKVEDPAIRNKLTQLLHGGLRWSESYTLKDGHVIGKGNKKRKVYVPEIDGPIADKAQYSAILRECKKLGIKGPHKLRSARMTAMAEDGASLFALMKFAGWSNADVAQSYITARDETVQELAEKRQRGRLTRLWRQIIEFFRSLLADESSWFVREAA